MGTKDSISIKDCFAFAYSVMHTIQTFWMLNWYQIFVVADTSGVLCWWGDGGELAPCWPSSSSRQEEHPGHAPTDLLPHLLDGADASREPRIDSEFSIFDYGSILCAFWRPFDWPATDQVSTFIWENQVTLIVEYNLQLFFPIGGKRCSWSQSR